MSSILRLQRRAAADAGGVHDAVLLELREGLADVLG
jgi:hypothetical protein